MQHAIHWRKINMHHPFASISTAHFDEIVNSVSGGEMETDPSFPAEVNRRIPAAQQVARINAEKYNREALRASFRLLDTALSSATSRKKVIWLQRAADQFARAYGDHAACKAGCSHCCHIPVTLTQAEARAISDATGRPLRAVQDHPASLDASYDNPCPFLTENCCSIYSHRPVACRVHLNMDNDDLLCRLVPGGSIPVPYANNRSVLLSIVQALDKSVTADIRQWFAPNVRG